MRRLDQGFTLSYALFVAIAFAALFSVLYYFGKKNLEFSVQSQKSMQAKYLAESANQRVLALLNTRTLPDSDVLDETLDASDDDDDIIGDEEEVDEEDAEEEAADSLLEIQPRYINYFKDDVFFVNIQSGDIINQDRYKELVLKDKTERANQAQVQLNQGEAPTPSIEELYYPLPEVNVQYLGLIKLDKYTHLKPGLLINLADKVKVNLKQKDILREYFGGADLDSFSKSRPLLRSITPNYAYPGDLIDVQVNGEALDMSSAKFSNGDLRIKRKNELAYDLLLDVTDKAKSGTYNFSASGKKANFYVLPLKSAQYDAPQIFDIYKSTEGHLVQLVEIYNNDRIIGAKIKGKNLSHDIEAPIITSDLAGVQFEITSFTSNEVIFNIVAKNLQLNTPFTITVFNKGGGSNSWAINVKARAENEMDLDPYTGVYSTRLTLLQANSLSNLPWAFDPDFENADKNSNRPEDASQEDPNYSGTRNKSRKKTFNLVNSDLETVWLLESIATVRGVTYKESVIVRRTVPQITAALTTNAAVDFSSKDFKIKGIEQASVVLQESLAKGDLILEFEDEFSLVNKASEEEENKQPELDGSAVVEAFDINKATAFRNLIQNFTKQSMLTVLNPSSFSTVTDFAYVKDLKPNTIILGEPGFKGPHFLRERLVQFIPAVLSDKNIDEREAADHLIPNYALLTLNSVNSFQKITNVLFADTPFLNYFKRDVKDQSPGGHTFKMTPFSQKQLAQYFDKGELFGLNVIQGTPNFTESSPLLGQGLLIIDTTEGGKNPAGETVRIVGSTKKQQSRFRGLIYIIGDVAISGKFEMTGAMIVKSPKSTSKLLIDSEGFIEYNLKEIQKTIFDLPFIMQVGTKKITKLREHKF